MNEYLAAYILVGICIFIATHRMGDRSRIAFWDSALWAVLWLPIIVITAVLGGRRH